MFLIVKCGVVFEVQTDFLYTVQARSGFKGLICRKFVHETDDLTSPPKEGVLRIFITVKNASPSAGSEPSNIGSDGKHAKH
jgi:hypothetical protein